MKEALKLGLEALHGFIPYLPLNDEAQCGRYDEAITAIKEALAQPEQEPLEYWNAVEGWVKIDEVREHLDSVGCGTIYKTAGEDRVPLYTTPPQRKPLTDEEVGDLSDFAYANDEEFVRNVEKYLKEKNNG